MASISSMSSAQASFQPTVNGEHSKTKEQVKQAFDNLKSALDSGDLSAAKDAYDTLQKLKPQKQGHSGSLANAKGKDQMDTLMSAVGDAISSGDISGAQSAFSKVQDFMKNNKPQGNPPSQNATQASAATSTNILDTVA